MIEAVNLILKPTIAALLISAVCAGCGDAEETGGAAHPDVSASQTAPSASVRSAQAPSQTAVQAPSDSVDITRFRNAFSSHPLMVDEMAETIRARDFQFALQQLQKLQSNPKLTAEERAASQDLAQQVMAASGGRAR